MSVFGIRKQLERQWRRWRRTAWTILACALVAYMAWLGIPLSGKVEKLMLNQPLSAEVLGSIIEQNEENSAEHQWMLQPNGEVLLKEQNEGSPEGSKRNGYIGIDKNGNLSLFEGPPKKEKVIKTFFQLDVEMMESALPDEVIKQLQQGISVQDIEEYNSVISTFSDYAVEDTNDPQPHKH